MKRRPRSFLTFLATIPLVYCACSFEPLSGNGGASETTNGITARVVYPGGSPGVHATVRLRQQDYLTAPYADLGKRLIASADSVTNDLGAFTLRDIDSGAYIVEVNDNKGNALALKTKVGKQKTVVGLGSDTLRMTGSVRGLIENTFNQQLFIQIHGLERITAVDKQSGAFSFDGLPSGKFLLHVVSGRPGIVSRDLDSVFVNSDDTAFVGLFSLGGPSRAITLNTMPSGVGVADNVIGFPVLVRLVSPDFDFSQARRDGSDIRFYKNSNIPLPFEIERWDSASGRAEMWVRLDTVFGNTTAQTIRMTWGDLSSVAPVNASTVFDTAAGFQGVWHMNEAGGDLCLDATAHHFDGTPSGMTPASATDGAIGGAQQFDGTQSVIRMMGTAQSALNFSENGAYTISAWVYADTLDFVPHLIAGKGHEDYYLKMMTNDSLKTLMWENVEYHGRIGWQITQNPATQKVWKYVVGVRDGISQRLYVDGALVDSTPRSIISGTIARNIDEDFSIGAYLRYITYLTPEGYCYFKGKIDEVRVCSVARSKAWIQLCYMNQKAYDALLHFQY